MELEDDETINPTEWDFVPSIAMEITPRTSEADAQSISRTGSRILRAIQSIVRDLPEAVGPESKLTGQD
jgi:hypothetical protein